MNEEIEKHFTKLNQRYVKSSRHTLEVDFVPYLDGFAELLDCKPRPQDYVLNDPRLAFAILFGPNVSYAYRLRGPHQWEGAREAILGVMERTEKCLSGRKEAGQTNDILVDWSPQFVLAIAFGGIYIFWMIIRLLFI